MSNTLINAVIALISERPADAREMLRSPEMRNISPGEVQSRLHVAIKDREIKAQVFVLKQVLSTALRINATEATENHTDLDADELFLMGVAEVERIIDNAILELES